ncbi:MAG: HypC/HybG/HupF family hydrogenase formation chaperone [Symbiobacteriaceae bacterium]
MAAEEMRGHPPDPCTPGDAGTCITCGDVAVPVRVVEVRGTEALVEDEEGRRETVAVDFVPDAHVGDILLVHAGIAIGRAGKAEGQVKEDR